jgi:hypothetical protein
MRTLQCGPEGGVRRLDDVKRAAIVEHGGDALK